MTAYSVGDTGFVWFLGKVVDLDDPLKLGRVRVRAYQEHVNGEIQDDDLHWATIMMPATSASTAAVGSSPTGIDKDCICFGFYMDGEHKQHPVVIGTWHNMPGMDPNRSDVSPLATGRQVLRKQSVGPEEPASAYGAEYPHNKVQTTKSGHAIEIDDTPGHERLHVYHKAGTYVEINNDGRIVIKCVDDSHEIVIKDKHMLVKGNMNVEVRGNLNAVCKQDVVVGAERNMTVASKGVLTLMGQSGVRIRSGADIAMAGPGGVSVTEGSLAVLGSISSGTGVSGSFTTPSGKTVHVTKGIVSNIT